jgi:ketosteroid isomerase-like protein
MLHQELLEHFYHSFKYKDAEGMVSCYHDDIVFTDPAFGTLKGNEAKNMWRMLLVQNSSLQIDYNNISADANTGKAHWKAEYVFSKTKRPVINNVISTFEFKDGKIIRQIDSFNLKFWAKQALGFQATILNVLGILPNTIQRKAKRSLQAYINKKTINK